MAGLDTELQAIVDDAAVASSALGTITAGSDAVVANFDGLQDLVDSLSAFASVMKSGVFYPPVGSIMPFAGASEPSDWLLCDGRALTHASVSTELKTLLQGAGWSTVPNLQGRTIMGVQSGTYGLASSGGGSTTLATNQLPSHTHTFTTSTDGQTAFPYAINQYAAGSGSAFSINVQSQGGGYIGGTFASANAHSHSGTTAPAGSGASVPTIPPYVITNYIIKN